MKAHSLFLLRRPACVQIAAAIMLSSRALAQITVTTAADENNTPAGAQISLREALRDSPDGGLITFDAALHGKVLVLTAGEMAVTGKTLTVNASGGFVIEARGLSRIFHVAAGAGLHLAGLTLQGGRAPADGGAILNAGMLSLTDCVLRDNRAADGAQGPPGATGGLSPGFRPPGGPGGPGGGGGAVSSTGSLSALRCHFTGNAGGTGGTGGTGGYTYNEVFQHFNEGPGGPGGVGGAGGAILNAGPLRLTECIFESNRSGPGGTGGFPGRFASYVPGGNGGKTGDGGAVFQAGDMTVERCSFVRNACPVGGQPGSTHSESKGGASGSGAAVFWNAGTATLTNCSFTQNRTGEGGTSPGAEHGGAVAAGGGTLLRLVHCTIAGNLAGRDRAGSQYSSWNTSTAAGIVSAAAVQCHNCIISGNMADRGPASGPPRWEEVNFSPNTPRTVIPFSLLGTPGVSAQLSALAITSGPLPVLVPEADSLALDAGTVIDSAPATDQRGLPRPVGAPDLGAVEVQEAEPVSRAYQTITFGPPAMFEASSVNLGATSSSGLPISYELISGAATLNGNTLSLTGSGLVAVSASQPGDEVTAPALSVVRVIDTARLQFIPFIPEHEYTVDIPNARNIILPAESSAGRTITWSLPGPSDNAVSLDSGFPTLRVSRVGSVQLQGSAPGTAAYDPVTVTWTLNFVDGALWWETPPAPGGGLPWFTLVEGSPHGLGMTARINGARAEQVAVPPVPGLTVTPSFIPAGQTSVQCLITVPANPQLANTTLFVQTGHPSPSGITLFLANRKNIPLNVFAPPRVTAGASTRVDVSCPGVTTPTLLGPPPDLGVRSVTVAASDFDNPAISIPVTLDSTTTGAGPYPTKYLRITFPPINRRVRLIVTTDDGITGQSGPIQIGDTNADGDGIDDLVEAALQRAPDQFHPPPLTIERDAAGLHAVLASRPLDLKGWTVLIEVSSDLETWTPAPAGSTTVAPNPDNTTERVSVLLQSRPEQHFVRLRVAAP